MLKRISVILFAAASFAGPAFADPRTDQQNAFGAEQHPLVLEKFGGEVADDVVTGYVTDLGQELAALTEQANDPWTFTVLDSPIVNAFALPGGYVYVTRGLLALANDEAELAAVLSHEIAHIVEDHLQDRNDAGGDALREGLLGALIGGLLSDGDDRLGDAIKSGIEATFGYLGEFTQGQEFEADKMGIELLARAGYDPQAQADFLESLAASHELESLLAGREYNPNAVAFFATHPADTERVERALREADLVGTNETRPRNQERYFDIIDGMIYGDSAEQGFVRRSGFFHPVMRFAYQVPEDFVITNSAQRVFARGPDGANMILTGGRAPAGSLSEYILRGWIPEVGRQTRIDPRPDVDEIEINGLEAATALTTIQTRQGEMLLRLTVIRRGDYLFRISGMSHPDAHDVTQGIFDAMQTFKSLEEWEADLLQPHRIEIRKVGWRDDVESLADEMPFAEYREERFRTLNGLEDDDELSRGDYVKVIVE